MTQADGKPEGVLSGLPDLDKLKQGFRDGELIIVAARPAVGKTAFALNVAHHAAMKQNTPALFVSLEMGSGELAGRLIAIDGRVDVARIRGGWQGRPELVKAKEATRRLERAKILILDAPQTGLSEIRSQARRFVQMHGKGPILVDYLQLIRTPAKVQRYEALGQISRGLKGLARELDVPVIALAQLGRGAEDASSGFGLMRHLRESGNLEADADAVIALRKPGEKELKELEGSVSDTESLIEITVCKHRNGGTGTFCARFEKESQRILPLEHQAPEPEPDYEDGERFDEYCEPDPATLF